MHGGVYFGCEVNKEGTEWTPIIRITKEGQEGHIELKADCHVRTKEEAEMVCEFLCDVLTSTERRKFKAHDGADMDEVIKSHDKEADLTKH